MSLLSRLPPPFPSRPPPGLRVPFHPFASSPTQRPFFCYLLRRALAWGQRGLSGECTRCWPLPSPRTALPSCWSLTFAAWSLLQPFAAPCFTRLALCLQEFFGNTAVLPEKMSNGMLKGISDKEALAEPEEGPVRPGSSPTFIVQETSL